LAVITGPHELIRQLRAYAAEHDQQARLLQQVRDRTADVSVTERSPDGVVTVTVDNDGLLTGLTFSDRAQGMRPAALSAAVMACVHTARGKIGAHIERIVRDTGVDDETATHFIADYRSHHPEKFRNEEFGMPVEKPQPMVVRRSSRPAPDEDADDFGDGFTVLRRGYGTTR
jgi:YbaB/EbfC DNA-binding family protein